MNQFTNYIILQTAPDLVAFYDIRPGNRAGLFFQTQNPHEVNHIMRELTTGGSVKPSPIANPRR